MESELQNVLIGIGVVVAILVASSAFAGTPMLVIPVFTGGVGAVVGALLGFAFFWRHRRQHNHGCSHTGYRWICRTHRVVSLE